MHNCCGDGYTDDGDYQHVSGGYPPSYPHEGLLSSGGYGIVDGATQAGDSRGIQRVETGQSAKRREGVGSNLAGRFWVRGYPADRELTDYYAPFIPELRPGPPCG